MSDVAQMDRLPRNRRRRGRSRRRPPKLQTKRKIGGEGKESNLPSPTRRDRPVLKTGGATGPLPSPLPGFHLTQRALSAEAAAASATLHSQTSPSFPHLAASGSVLMLPAHARLPRSLRIAPTTSSALRE